MCQGCHDASKIQNKKEKPRKTEQENPSPSEPSTLMRIVEQPIGMCSCQDAKFNFAATLSSVSKENTWPQMQFRTDSEHKKKHEKKEKSMYKSRARDSKKCPLRRTSVQRVQFVNCLTLTVCINPPYSWEIHQEFLRSKNRRHPLLLCSQWIQVAFARSFWRR